MIKRGFDELAALSDAELEQGLRGLLGYSARTEARIVAHLAEVESRRLHLRAGYPSMFQYCLAHLGLSENEAFHRIVAARLAAAFPVIFELLEAREVHLSAVCLLRRHLTSDNHRELLAEVCGKSKRQVEELLVRRFPDSVAAQSRAARFKPVDEDCFRLELYVTKAQKEKLELVRDLVSHANPSGDWAVVLERAADALAEKVQGRRFAKLKEAKRAGVTTTQADPRGDHTQQTARGDDTQQTARGDHTQQTARSDHALETARGDHTQQTARGDHTQQTARSDHALETARGDHTQQTAPSANGGRRHIPNPVRRLVAERDEMKCTFTSETGRRCGARAFVQFDHRQPWASGGQETGENLRILCAAHNRLRAEQAFGAAALKHRARRPAKQTGSVAAGSALCPGKAPKSAA